jgi:hypothetical protein
LGFRISWIAAKGMSKADLLGHFGFRDTGEKDEANEAPFSVAELPTGWTVLWSNDQTFAKIEICTPLSLKAPVLSCWVNETVMFSSANYFDQGNYLWFVGHDAQRGMNNLELDGDLPSQFSNIRDGLVAQQVAAGGEDADVDFIFDVPLELAQSVCGFKHDLCDFEWGTPEFSVVDNADFTEQTSEVKAKSGWISRLFGKD